MLRMQDLTDADIKLFIKDRLVDDEMMEALSKKEPIECQMLINEILEAAKGVFLWVTLVVNDLLNGLTNYDRIINLQKRLRAIPETLDAFYEHIVLKVHPVYEEEASRLY